MTKIFTVTELYHIWYLKSTLIQSHSVFKFSLHFKKDRDQEVARTEDKLEHQVISN